ncbi:MAG TPA: hypothetical protein VMN60_05945 [Longimicrobiales bacterium]|nr:hypothetical protein [Longimicrobiales bacterium]
MNAYRLFALLLIVVAAASIALQIHHYRRGVISLARAVTASVARSGFIVLGVIYATDMIRRWPRAPLAGLAIVGAGIFLHLANNILENVRGREG